MPKLLLALLFTLFSLNAMSQTPEQYIEAARKGLSQQTSAHNATWHLGNEEQWSADLNAGLVVFEFSDGVRATAPIQVVGTYNQVDGTFLWGWDHPSVPEPLRKHASLAKQWGEQNQLQDYTLAKSSVAKMTLGISPRLLIVLQTQTGFIEGLQGAL